MLWLKVEKIWYYNSKPSKKKSFIATINKVYTLQKNAKIISKNQKKVVDIN